MKSLETSDKEKRIKLRSKLKLNFKHSNNDSLICSVECSRNLLKLKARKCYRPYPISQGSTDDLVNNPLLTLVQKKQEYQLKIETVKHMYHKYQRAFQVYKQFDSYQAIQNLLSKEPDKYFSSNYNWYCTGGNLTIQKIRNTDLMFYTNKAELCIGKLKKRDSGWIMQEKNVLSNHSSDIYQLESVNNASKTFVSVRQRHDILLYDMKLNDDDDVICELANIQNTDVPFVAMCLNTQNHEEYATANVNQALQIWDLCTLKPVIECKIPHDMEALEGDCFAQVSYNNNNVLMYINRTNFYIFDKRTNCISSHFDSIDFLQFYDRFVNICHRQYNSAQYYISTFNEVLIFDARFKNVLSKYSHAFTSAPYISDLKCNNNSSMFCISSCKPDEKIVLEQTQNMNYIPVLLPTITDSFESSLLLSSNMDMSLCIRERLDASTTGMHLWSSDDDTFTVFSINTVGDIYCHEIPNNLAKNERNENFQNWNNQIIDKRKANNQMNFIDKMVLNDMKFKIDSEPIDLISVIKTKRLQDCIQDLKKCKKGSRLEICDLWDNGIQSNGLGDIEKIPVDVSVRNWLSQFCPQQEQPVS